VSVMRKRREENVKQDGRINSGSEFSL